MGELIGKRHRFRPPAQPPNPPPGKKPGAVTVKSREIANKLMSDGEIQPLEVMYANMRYYSHEATTLAQQLSEFARQLKIGTEGGRLTVAQALVINKLIDRVDTCRDRAQRAAEGAANFVHARPQAISFEQDGQPLRIFLAPGLEDV